MGRGGVLWPPGRAGSYGYGLTYQGAAKGHLRILYDGELWTDGSVEGLELGGWRAAGSVNRQELSANIASTGVGLEFGVRYAYAGPLLVEMSFGVGGRCPPRTGGTPG